MTIFLVVAAVGLLACAGGALTVRSTFSTVFSTLGEKRVSANQLKSTTIVRQLAMAQVIAQREFEDVESPTIAFLIQQDFITEELLQSPFGPVKDGGGRDYWLHPSRPSVDSTTEARRFVIAYDRAMYRHHDSVSVAYHDGKADLLDRAAFEALLRARPNGGVDYELPTRP